MAGNGALERLNREKAYQAGLTRVVWGSSCLGPRSTELLRMAQQMREYYFMRLGMPSNILYGSGEDD
jgi:hypothetical protein